MTNPPCRVVVVGAGLAGLTAAATAAAAAGAHVTLLEARAHAGGRARTAHRRRVPPQPGRPRALPRRSGVGGAHRLRHHAAGTVASRGRRGGPARRRHPRRAPGQREKPAVARACSRRAPSSTWRACSARPHRLAGSVVPGTSMQEWIDAAVTAPRRSHAARRCSAGVATYCGDLGALDARAGVAQVVQAMTHGVVYLDDGWQQLVDGMQRRGPCSGRDPRTRAPRSTRSIGAPTGSPCARASGDLDADAVVLAVGWTAPTPT